MPTAKIASTFPDADTFASTAKEILHGADYALDIHPEQMLFTKYMATALDYAWKHLRPLLETSQNYLETSPVMYYASLIICILILAGIFGDLIFSLYLAARRERAELDLRARIDRAENGDELWAAAEQAATAQDFLSAIRGAWRATLWQIDDGKIQPAATNRQYLRRFVSAPFAVDLRALIELVEMKWYGGEPCEISDWQNAKMYAKNIVKVADAKNSLSSSPSSSSLSASLVRAADGTFNL